MQSQRRISPCSMVSRNGGLAAVTTWELHNAHDEIIRELSDVELEKVTGAYYCVDSSLLRRFLRKENQLLLHLV